MNSLKKHSGKLEIFRLANTNPVILKPFNETLLAGASGYQSFSSPADDYPDMDLFSFLIKNSETTFPAKIEGDCLSEIGVLDNDWAIIEKGLTPKDMDLVAVYIDEQPYIGVGSRKVKKTGLRIISIVNNNFNSYYKLLFILNGLNSPGFNVNLLSHT